MTLQHQRGQRDFHGDKASLLERACARFADYQAVNPDLSSKAIPQLEWRQQPAVQPSAEPQAFPSPSEGLPHATDRRAMRRMGLLVPGEEGSGLAEEYRILRRAVLEEVQSAAARGMGAKARRVLVCSPQSGEGKTFTALNLALSLASESQHAAAAHDIVLIDADAMKPSVSRLLGLPQGPGLLDALRDPSLRAEDCLIRTDCAGLQVLPAGLAVDGDGEVLAGAPMQRVLDELQRNAPDRLILIDTPPALVSSAAAEIAEYVGQCLLIARAGITGQSALEDCAVLLNRCPSVNLLLNAAFFSPSGRKFGSYYGDTAGMRRGAQ